MSDRRFAGSDWLTDGIGVTKVSPLGRAVADLLGDVFAGIYHLNPKSLRKVEWANSQYIIFNLDRDLSTFDFDHLTQLVVLCHDRCLRMSIRGAAPGILQLMFHQRERNGNMWQCHPTLEQATDQIRACHA